MPLSLSSQSVGRFAASFFAAILTISNLDLFADEGFTRSADEGFTQFARDVMPVLESRQCRECHNSNGVASDTELRFPESSADETRVTAFGLSLRELVDVDSPDDSLLWQMPTNRTEHSGGQRIQRGSRDEATLRRWIDFLVSMDEQQQSDAERLIESARRLDMQPLTIRRLTNSQYNNTVRDLLSDQSQPANRFPNEDFVNGFKNQSAAQGISPLQSEAYSAVAERLALAAFRGGDHLNLISNDPGLSDAKKAELFVQSFGRRAFRRPLDEHEVGVYTQLLLAEQRRGGRFLDGTQLVVEAMLQSPNFLFRIESHSDAVLADYAMASRLSYFLWDTMPDESLMKAAQAGQLRTREQIESEARRMLDDERARQSLHEFLSQWLRLDRVRTAIRDRRKFRGQFSSETAEAMVEETTRLFDHLVWNDENFMEFFTADYSFVNSELAQLYEMTKPESEFARTTYSAASTRSGILGHGSFLVLTSKPSETSPTARGLFVRNKFLGHEVPPPPPGTNTQLPETSAENPMTNRDRLNVHLNSEACSNCHQLIDPIGFGLEQFDPIGRFETMVTIRSGGRDSETNIELPIDTSAFVKGMPDSEFTSPKELGAILAGSETCQRCITKQMFRYAFGRVESEADAPVVESVLKQFRESEFRFRELVLAIVTSDLFINEHSVKHEKSE